MSAERLWQLWQLWLEAAKGNARHKKWSIESRQFLTFQTFWTISVGGETHIQKMKQLGRKQEHKLPTIRILFHLVG